MPPCHVFFTARCLKITNMRKLQRSPFGSTLETIMYPFLLLVLMWSIHLLQHLQPHSLFNWGILPKDWTGLRGVVFSPLLHATDSFSHILNNSLPIAVLLGATIYFYREVAAKVFVFSWFASGLLVWLFAQNTGSYHVGMSGVIYALAGFLFVSGTLRKHSSLQAISLFVTFVYGSMIWGVLPTGERVSWEGHLTGLIVGIALALIFRKKGVQPPKYQYEIEKEMGIEPPDLEGMWLENMRKAEERAEALRQQENQPQTHVFVYEYVPKIKPGQAENDPPKDQNLPTLPAN